MYSIIVYSILAHKFIYITLNHHTLTSWDFLYYLIHLLLESFLLPFLTSQLRRIYTKTTIINTLLSNTTITFLDHFYHSYFYFFIYYRSYTILYTRISCVHDFISLTNFPRFIPFPFCFLHTANIPDPPQNVCSLPAPTCQCSYIPRT